MVTGRPIMVAEFTTNHLGNLNLLMRMVDAAAAAGCDLIKMQKKDVGTFYSPEKLAMPYESPYGTTYREYRETFEFGRADFQRLDDRCRERHVRWFATAQDVPSLEFLLDFAPPLLKVASCNARNLPFLKEVARATPGETGIVVSLAGSTLPEVDATVELFADRELWVLHCVAEYPCPQDRLRLGNIARLIDRYGGSGVRVGYSGHEVGIEPSVVAMDLGAQMVERHFCISRHSFAHHIECSLEPHEFAELVRLARHPDERGPARRAVDPAAAGVGFTMTPLEREFLVQQTYGHQHLGTRSDFRG
jgi:N-acetylneuraminate synthase